MAIHVVKANESVDDIAAEYKVPSDKVIYVNQLIYPYQLAVGQALLIPDDSPNPQKKIKANGYAYPFISIWVLEQTLPYLTELSVFSYGFTVDGELLPPELNPTVMIEKAKEFDVVPVLTLTPFGRDGHFNNRLISAIVNDMVAQKNLIQDLLRTMKEKGYRGLDIDFEYILPEDRDAYTTFVKNMTLAMNRNNYTVSVALAPKSAVTQTGLLYEGKTMVDSELQQIVSC